MSAASQRVTRILRFDRVQRAAHWANATLFGILMLTALPLYFGSIEKVVGRHVLISQIHVWAGVALPVPLLVSLIGPWGARMRRDVRRITVWTPGEIKWLRTPVSAPPVVDKFNPGQKLNAIFVAGSIIVMLGSGVVLKWFGFFPVGWRSGATFVHELLSWAIFIVVFGHIGFAVTHRDALRAMIRGWVTESWARRNAPAWLAEMKAADRAGAAPPGSAPPGSTPPGSTPPGSTPPAAPQPAPAGGARSARPSGAARPG